MAEFLEGFKEILGKFREGLEKFLPQLSYKSVPYKKSETN